VNACRIHRQSGLLISRAPLQAPLFRRLRFNMTLTACKVDVHPDRICIVSIRAEAATSDQALPLAIHSLLVAYVGSLQYPGVVAPGLGNVE